MAVIAELLGVPEEDRALLRPWSADICRMYELHATPEDERVAVRACLDSPTTCARSRVSDGRPPRAI